MFARRLEMFSNLFCRVFLCLALFYYVFLVMFFCFPLCFMCVSGMFLVCFLLFVL